MKIISLILFAATVAAGCGREGTGPAGNFDLTASFSLTDTTGRAGTNFQQGENFDLSFYMVNNTFDTLVYYGGPQPPVSFQLLKNGKVVATSVDGFLFPQVVVGRALLPGDTLRGYWRAPTTPAQDPKVSLSPGVYQAEVSFPAFKDKSVNAVQPIPFTVVR